MDRISALRNVEDALSEFEAGESDLASMERRVRGVLRTYATEFAEQDAYRASGAEGVDGVVVLASSPSEARERAADLTGVDRGSVSVDRVE
ncbi:DUF7854 family protein [Halomarina oriensis]|uniref:Uncharacterized protein n=1 Tax=Halomarina oriensis TaxID=671145 RepID=A0A6B0GIL4_9EURY|nr:hypothetical protein [Halomarina oriensis]MWG34594.1 hypothetical protein [Halomarina oriensis]